MKHICIRCGRTADTSNLLCPEVDCPARTIAVLGYGHQIGDSKIARPLQVMQTATLYEGMRNDQPVLLKIAHHGGENQLRNEANWLRAIMVLRQRSRLGKLLRSSGDPYPGIPHLLPAYAQASLVDFPYGSTVLNGQEIYYEMFEYVEGVFLREILTRMPNPWYPNAVWLAMSVAEVIHFMNAQFGALHLKLSPDAILVRTDANGVMRPVLLDFGLLADLGRPLSADDILWLHRYSAASYTPPELVFLSPDDIQEFSHPNPVQDVYGLGLLLFEMLAGAPKFDFRLLREANVRKNIKRDAHKSLVRQDIPGHEAFIAFVEQATHRSPQRRQPATAIEFYRLLKDGFHFHAPPKEKKHSSGQERAWRLGLVVGVLLGLLILLGAILSPTPPA